MKNLIKEDISSYSHDYHLRGCFFSKWAMLMLMNRSFRSLWYYRIGRWSWLFRWWLKGEPTLHISKSCKIGGGTLFFHSYGTTMNAWSIGEHSRITCNITLGDKAGKRPVIGNRVEILPGAVIAGDVNIGDDCVIGPNCVVHKSVPANCVVIGNPAIILKENGVVVRKPL